MSKKKHDPVYERLLSVLNPPNVTCLYDEYWQGDRWGDEADKVQVKLLKVRGWDDEGCEYVLRWVESEVWTVLGGWNKTRELVDKRSDTEAIRLVQKLLARLVASHPSQQWQVGALVAWEVDEDGGDPPNKDEVGRVVAMAHDDEVWQTMVQIDLPSGVVIMPRGEAQWRFRVVATGEMLLDMPLAAKAHRVWQNSLVTH
jgi:hypothetical protein